MMLRRLHTVLSMLSAPIILFFCLSGAVQLFDWHEPRGGYRPPVWIEKLSMLHKKQRFAVRGSPQRDAGGAVPASGGSGRRLPPPVTARVMLLRWVFLLATLSLTLSTILGTWIGLTHSRRRRLCWLLLGAGTALPLLMVAI